MALFDIAENNKPGFIVDSTDRAELLAKYGFNLPKAKKTGTTICGVIYKDGVILGADTRATEDDTVSDKNCVKIHYMQDNIFCCGAGTAADTDMTTRMISSQLELHKYYTGRQVQTNCAKHVLKQLLYRYQGHISAALIIGGVDVDGSHLYSIYPHGSSDSLPFVTMGSGSLAAIAHFEKNFKVGMDEEEAKELIRDAVCGGIFNDLGSGSNVDLCIIRKNNTEFLRTYDEANEKGVRENRYVYPSGTSTVRKFKIEDIEVQETVEHIAPDDQMDTSS